MSDDNTTESLLEFPCDFPVKVMGRDEPAFRTAVAAIFEKHVGDVDASQYRESQSRNANFISLTVTIRATSQAQLDGIYSDLSANDDVLVAL